MHNSRRNLTIAIASGLAIVGIIFWIVHRSQAAQLAGTSDLGGPGARTGRAGAGHAGGGSGGPVAVAVATATSGDIQVRVPALGTVTPVATVTVKTQISGQLQLLGFKEGQEVRKGDFLAQIDPRPYESALQQAQGNLQRDQATLAEAKRDLVRYQDLVKTDLVARQQLDAQTATVAQSEGVIVSDTAQVNIAKLNLQYTHIVAPVAGRTGLRQVDQGNYVTPGDANGIVVVTQLEPITVIFPVPEDNISAIARHFRAGGALIADAFDRSNTTHLAQGKLISIDNEIDTTTGTVKLRAQFDNRDGALFPNQFVNVQLLVDTLRSQVVIPIAAVQHGAPNGVASSFVYLVDPAGIVSVHPIVVGTTDGERTTVTLGLKVGDVVVTQGGDRLRDGAKVAVPDDTRSNAGTAPAGRRNSSGKWSGRRKESGSGAPDGK